MKHGETDYDSIILIRSLYVIDSIGHGHLTEVKCLLLRLRTSSIQRKDFGMSIN